jgi:hypothetical protein
MTLFELLFLVAFIGLVAWGLVHYIPMSEGIAKVVQGVALVVVIWLVLAAFGLLPRDVPVPRF